MRAADGGLRYFCFDPMGNTSALTDAAGAVTDWYVGDPFGVPLLRAGATEQPFAFMGEQGVPDGAGGPHARARHYAPALGRFLQPDPLGLGGGEHLYAYGYNNPLSYDDPSGLFFKAALSFIFRWNDPIRTAATTRDPTETAMSVVTNLSACPPLVGTMYQVASATPQVANGMIATYNYRRRIEAAMNLGNNRNADMGLICGTRRWYEKPKPPQRPSGNPLFRVTSVGSMDPNEKWAVQGHGPANHVRSGTRLIYRVEFENLAAATAPAQIVTIRDPLSALLDWESCEILAIGFGGEVITPAPGLRHFAGSREYAYADDDYAFAIEVHVEAGIDLGEGVFSAAFYSLDPTTGLPPADAAIGFLPPEDATGRGRGYVAFAINHLPDLADGAAIRNVATIQFDYSLEIATNQIDPMDPAQGTDPAREALVTIDAAPPQSQVAALPATTATPQFSVAWAGDDGAGGSGIGGYDVYVRVDAGAWEPWLEATTATTAQYAGADGHAYAFYSVATDLVGWREAKAPQAEAVTSVSVPPAGQLTVAIEPPSARTAGAAWSVDNGVNWHAVGTHALEPGAYSVRFAALAGWHTPAVQPVQVPDGGAAAVAALYLRRIPTAWLNQHQLPVDGSADFTDSDGDGYSNWHEWLAGTNPRAAESAMQLVAVADSVTAQGFRLRWPSVAGKVYRVERSTGMTAGRLSFTVIAGGITGQAGFTEYVDNAATGAAYRFYRISIEQAP
jgi:RHS repeat-associated protein